MGQYFIAIIPHTWFNTNLRNLIVGDFVNLEADALIKYVERLLFFDSNKKANLSSIDISSAWLKDNGWQN